MIFECQPKSFELILIFYYLFLQKACGILDTNCFEIKWDRGIARGLFKKVSYINHDCAPNCRKFFDAQRSMHVLSSNEIQSNQEFSLSYTNPLFSTPMRQVDIFEMYDDSYAANAQWSYQGQNVSFVVLLLFIKADQIRTKLTNYFQDIFRHP